MVTTRKCFQSIFYQAPIFWTVGDGLKKGGGNEDLERHCGHFPKFYKNLQYFGLRTDFEVNKEYSYTKKGSVL